MNKTLRSQDVQDAKRLQKQGGIFLRKQEYAQAVDCFLKLVAYSPSPTKIFLLLGFCYQKMGLIIQALTYYLKAKQNPLYRKEAEKKIEELSELMGPIMNVLVYQAFDITSMDTTQDHKLLNLQNHLEEYRINVSIDALKRLENIVTRVPGYGTIKQYLFFNCIVSTYKPQKILLIGVYRGRDASFILDAAKTHNVEVDFTGVDKFSDDFCEDWPEEDRAKNWAEAGFGIAPDIEETRRHLRDVGFSKVNLIKMHDAEFLAQDNNTYDFIYIDTAHDYDTVKRQIHQVKRLCHDKTIVSGDDYSSHGTCRVPEAVRDGTKEHGLFLNWIWYTFGNLV